MNRNAPIKATPHEIVTYLKILPLWFSQRMLLGNLHEIYVHRGILEALGASGKQETEYPSPKEMDDARSLIESQIPAEALRKVMEGRFSAMEKCRSNLELFWLIDKPHRLTLLNLAVGCMEFEATEYAKILKFCWTATEFPHQMSINDLVWLFKRTTPEMLMRDKPSDFEKYRAFEGVVTVFRGTQVDGKSKIRGLSWTLSRDSALWFSQRWGTVTGKVYIAQIPKERIFMYTNDRGEEEVVLNPRALKGLRECTQEELTNAK